MSNNPYYNAGESVKEDAKGDVGGSNNPYYTPGADASGNGGTPVQLMTRGGKKEKEEQKPWLQLPFSTLKQIREPAAANCEYSTLTVKEGGKTLRCTGLHASMQCHVSTAFVVIKGTFERGSKSTGNCTVLFPRIDGATVTDMQAVVDGKQFFSTDLVENSEEAQKDLRKALEKPKDKEVDVEGTFDPNSVQLPLINVKGQTIEVTIEYMQNASFSSGAALSVYSLRVPMKLTSEQLAGQSISEVLRIAALVHSPVSANQSAYASGSHPVKRVEGGGNNLKIEVASDAGAENADFILHYSVDSDLVTASALISDDSFSVFVTPPTGSAVQKAARVVVLMLDCSGSMYGDTIENAKMALLSGLNLLHPGERFAVVKFTHVYEVLHLSSADPVDMGSLPTYRATEANVAAACQSVRGWTAGGGTDILTPLSFVGDAASRSNIPVNITMITDGAVGNEREIVNCMVKKEMDAPITLSTFGIGPYCNSDFLQMLAESCKGRSRMCLQTERVKDSIAELLESTSRVVATNFKLTLPNGTVLKSQAPSRVPDLFAGAPVMVGGIYSGNAPEMMTLTFTDHEMKQQSLDVHCIRDSAVPVSAIYVREELDSLCARAWLQDDPNAKKKAVDLSLRSGVPCKHTAMVASEKKELKTRDERKAERKSGGGARTAALVAAGAIGGVVLVGVMFPSFGNAAMTSANSATSAAMSGTQSLFSGLNFPTCGCGPINCSIHETCVAVCGDCGSGIMNSCGGVFEFCGNACSPCGHVVNFFYSIVNTLSCHCLDGCGNILGQCTSGCAAARDSGDGCISGATGGCGSMCSHVQELCSSDLCGTCMGNCTGAFGELGSIFGECCSGLIGVCGDLPNLLGGLCGPIGDCLGGLGGCLGGLGGCLEGGCGFLGDCLGALDL